MTIRLVQELKLHIACCPCLGGKSLSTQIYIAAILRHLFRAQSMAKDAQNVGLDCVIFISSSHVLDTVVCNFTAYHFEIKKTSSHPKINKIIISNYFYLLHASCTCNTLKASTSSLL